jgi:hypothetical protein
LITPPISMNLFVIAGVAKDLKTVSVMRGVIPFILSLCDVMRARDAAGGVSDPVHVAAVDNAVM